MTYIKNLEKILKKYSSLKKDHALLSNEFDTLKKYSSQM